MPQEFLKWGGTLVLEAGRQARPGIEPPHERDWSDRPAGVSDALATDQQPKTRQRSQSRRSDGLRIAVVDDHNIVREGLTLLLSTQPDFEVVGEAADGEQGIELVRSHQPDVVIMDVSMPRLNGIEATRIIKRDFPGVRVIGLSMHESVEMSNAMLQAGVSAYLPKGGPSDKLFAAIRMSA